jgi:ABC-type transport system involved in cytochrome bd biosynthesis fused ATPase/permease subunit
MMGNPKEGSYSTYRGAGHVSLFFGIPLMLALSLIGLLVTAFFVFVVVLKWVVFGLFLISVLLIIGVWAHLECVVEARAMEIRILELKGLFLKLLHGVTVLEVTSAKQTEKKEVENVERFIKKIHRF